MLTSGMASVSESRVVNKEVTEAHQEAGASAPGPAPRAALGSGIATTPIAIEWVVLDTRTILVQGRKIPPGSAEWLIESFSGSGSHIEIWINPQDILSLGRPNNLKKNS